MEPREPAKKDESSGFSRRRTSSILKIPQKCAQFSQSEQEEYTMECAKPVEKRISKRVSFAPADDVLLFPKALKSTSPVRSPLQDLMTSTTATTNRVQVTVTEDGIQPVKGVDTLLKAPLHVSQQRERVIFDMREDYGEKTMFFTDDDVFMDMTQSHTVNIGVDAVTGSSERAGMNTAASESMHVASGPDSLPCGRNVTLSLEKESHSAFDQECQNFLASVSKSSGPLVNPVVTKMTPARASSELKTCPQTQRNDVDKENVVCFPMMETVVDKPSMPREIGEAFSRNPLFPEDDVSRSTLEAFKGSMQGSSRDDENFSLFPTQGMFSQSEKRMSQTLDMKYKQQQCSKALCLSDPKAVTSAEKKVQMMAIIEGSQSDMTSLKNSVLCVSDQKHKNFEARDDCREKTVHFSAMGAAMDATESHTVDIDAALDAQTQQNLILLPASGEKTVHFSAMGAAMDATESHTVNIDAALDAQTQQNLILLPAGGEKTVHFTATGAAMDTTQSHTVNIDAALEARLQTLRTCGEKTLWFNATDAAMDMTQSHTDATQSHTDAAMDGTQSHTGATQSHTDAAMENTRFSANDGTKTNFMNNTTNLKQVLHQNIEEETMCHVHSCIAQHQCPTINISAAFDSQTAAALVPESPQNVDKLPFSVDSIDSMMDITKMHTVHVTSNMVMDTAHLQQDPNSVFAQRYMDLILTEEKTNTSQSPQNADTNRAKGEKGLCGVNTGPQFVHGTTENEALTDCLEDDVRTDKTVGETHPTCTDNPSQCLPSQQDSSPGSDRCNTTEETLLQSNDEPSSVGLEIVKHPGYVDTNESAAGLPSVDAEHNESALENSRHQRLAGLQLKMRRLSHRVLSPDAAMARCSAPLAQLEQDVDTARALLVVEPEQETLALTAGEQASAAVTPFKLKTKQLMSRLSIGRFKPKLPDRSRPSGSKKGGSSGDTVTISVTRQLSNFNNVVSDIFDEELIGYEDMSETLSPQKISENVCSLDEAVEDRGLDVDVDEAVQDRGLDVDVDEAVQDRGLDVDVDEAVQDRGLDVDVAEVVQDRGLDVDVDEAAHVQKRPLLDDDRHMEHEKRAKTSPEVTLDSAGMEVQSDVSQRDGHMTTAGDLSSHTASIRCDSSSKHSMFESQLEDYACDVQKKFDDGTISVSEFFKLFNIDFVIHNPRQSVFTATNLENAGRTHLDLLKDKHINRPKQLVYEADVLNLTEEVERMKMRTRDLTKPLRLVNRCLWEEMRSLSEEELKLFGAKLTERNKYFRRLSKTHSHEMKEVLYSNLLQAHATVQQTLRRATDNADEMIKSLNDCIHDVEAELVAGEKGSEGRSELKKVTEALTDSQRQVSELEMQNKQRSNKLNRLKAEMRKLQDHVTVLHEVNEWKLGKKTHNCTTYMFLYDTMHLHVVYETSKGQTVGNGADQKILDITFKFVSDAEAEFNARLVHKLLSQYVEKESAWVNTCPSMGHVPKLLHDLSLVVGCCRLLGEELRLLQMWGSLKLDVLDISTMDTEVRITFSSLRRFAKFQVMFAVSLINQLYVLQLQSFTNMIGTTTKQQVEEIVVSFNPGKNVLTKVVKKIHETLLC